MDNQKMSNLKPIISIVDACKLVRLSRARFYQLLEQGIFPQPLYHIRTKRPYYDIELQQKLLEIRDTGIGANNDFMLFYSPRKKNNRGKKCIVEDPVFKEYADTLNSMGLFCSSKEVADALKKLYPDGVGKVEDGVIVRDLFRYLGSK